MNSIDDYRWLVSTAGADFIRAASELLAAGDIVAATSRLRKDLSPARTHLVIQQAQLQQRAREKFAAAERMFFTDVGLQQATGEIIADYKAQRFPRDEQVIDLCCGIGGDLFSLARNEPACGIDRDEVAALLAEANCRALGLNAATVRREDVTMHDIAASSLIHIDPDRRPQGKRTTNVAMHEPNDAFLEKLFAHCRGGAIKLAPAADIPQHWRERCEFQWISHRGECKQLVVWFGALAHSTGCRTATMLSRDGAAHSMVADEQEAANAPAIARAIGKYFYEPDAAVIAARLVGVMANRHGLAATAAGIAYLTGERLTMIRRCRRSRLSKYCRWM